MYKRTLIIMLSIILAAFQAGNDVHAQNYVAPEVEISKEKIKIDGKVFLSHIVKERQTLYSISKAYNVSIDELYRYNSGLKEEGLKKNSILLVPFNETKEKTIRIEEEVQEEKVAEPVKPEKKSRRNKNRKSKEADALKTHVVKWFEDIKSIATKYDVSIESIMKANDLVSPKLRTRQRLIIPDKDITVPVQEEGGKADTEEKNTIAKEPAKGNKKDWKNILFFPKTSVDITTMLPLQAKEGKYSRNFMDFYSGSLMAVKDLKEEGINTNLNIFDTNNESIAGLGPVARTSDIVIGPVAPDQLDSLYIVCGANVPVISPLDPKTESMAYERKKFIYAPTSHEKQYLDICRWAGEDLSEGEHITVIFEKNGYKTNHHPTVTGELKRLAIPYTEFSYSILEGREIKDSLKTTMTTEKANRVIIASESEAFVNDIVRNINLLRLEEMDIVLYATGKIRSFETIAPADLHKNKLHSSMAYNIDYESRKVKEFLKEYRALFNSEPSQFAFQGYDLTRFAVEMFSRHGAGWLEHATKEKIDLLQSSYLLENVNNNGFVNTATRRVVYEDDFKVTVQEVHER